MLVQAGESILQIIYRKVQYLNTNLFWHLQISLLIFSFHISKDGCAISALISLRIVRNGGKSRTKATNVYLTKRLPDIFSPTTNSP